MMFTNKGANLPPKSSSETAPRCLLPTKVCLHIDRRGYCLILVSTLEMLGLQLVSLKIFLETLLEGTPHPSEAYDTIKCLSGKIYNCIKILEFIKWMLNSVKERTYVGLFLT